jgi:hypothetical protein
MSHYIIQTFTPDSPRKSYIANFEPGAVTRIDRTHGAMRFPDLEAAHGTIDRLRNTRLLDPETRFNAIHVMSPAEAYCS